MLISKSDFLKYLQCPEYFWMVKYKSDDLTSKFINPFTQQLIDQGIEVESWARKLYPKGHMIHTWGEESILDTQKAIDAGRNMLFQPAFSAEGLMARIDILEKTENGWNIYEVKGSSSKERKKEEHYWDAIFQREVMIRAGYVIDKVLLIELNKEFVKDGEIDPAKLLKTSDITQELQSMNEEIRQKINLAKAFLRDTSQPITCNCHLKSRKNQCPAFTYFNPDFPLYSVHDLARVSPKKLQQFADLNVITIDEIPASFELTNNQKNQVWTYQKNETIIKQDEIDKQLSQLEYPLYFLDYETYPTAVPVYDGCYPYQQVPFQYSLHILKKPGDEYIHKEYLHSSTSSPTRPIAESLCNNIGEKGSVIVWNKKFEKKCNEDLANMYPDLAENLASINERIFDLMEIFSKQNYVHKDFKGSASIKKVLPVICPELSYAELSISEGGEACSKWKYMVFGSGSKIEKQKIAEDLLAYCKLDTWAMVRIWEELN